MQPTTTRKAHNHKKLRKLGLKSIENLAGSAAQNLTRFRQEMKMRRTLSNGLCLWTRSNIVCNLGSGRSVVCLDNAAVALFVERCHGAVSKRSLELLATRRVSLMVNNTWQWIHSALSDVVSVTVGWRSHRATKQRPDDKSNNSISLAVLVSHFPPHLLAPYLMSESSEKSTIGVAGPAPAGLIPPLGGRRSICWSICVCPCRYQCLSQCCWRSICFQ